MKFLYADESGEKDHSKFFVMCGVMIDSVHLRKRTEEFDKLWLNLLELVPDSPEEIKTSRMINGKGAWRKVCSDTRKQFVSDVIEIALKSGGKIFCLPMDLEKFETAVGSEEYNLPDTRNKWTYGALYLASLVQKKMQKSKNNKGLTVFIMDDNQAAMPTLTGGLYRRESWYDGLYVREIQKRGEKCWKERTEQDRFDQIINTAFSINSEHSTYVQVADVISYVYRRYFELTHGNEKYEGEQKLYCDWVRELEKHRQKLGKAQACDALKFYKNIVPDSWSL